MKLQLYALLATTALVGCATTGPAPVEVAEQTQTVGEAAAGPVSPAPAEKAQIGAWGFDLAGMDPSVEPGDNFYKFANGTWARTTPIPADRSNFGMFAVLEELSNERTREILEEQAKVPGSKIGDFYASFMDRSAVNAQGFAPIAPVLNRIGAARTKEELAAVMGELARIGVNVPFGNYVDSDDKDPNSAIFQFAQGGIGLRLF